LVSSWSIKKIITAYEYNSLGQLTAVENAEGDTTTYKYDAWGNLVGTTVDPSGLNIQTAYFYDDFGRLIKTSSPDANETIYVYNSTGTLAQKKEGCISGTCAQTT
jgi:YD repeat-containing protein